MLGQSRVEFESSELVESDRIADEPVLRSPPTLQQRVDAYRRVQLGGAAAVMGTDMVTISASVLKGALTTRAKVVLGWVRLFRRSVIVWNVIRFGVLVGVRCAVYKYYRYFRRF